jgi:homoserine kinase
MIEARAPASTANLGPGFDAAGAALDLWSAVEVEEAPFSVEIVGEGADELPHDASHLALRAFAVFAEPTRFRFRFTNRIPLERGLGSSAAAIGLGLVAGARAAGRDISADELLLVAARFESHLDNLAAVLHGGVCVAWRGDAGPRAHRIAADMPAVPLAVVPLERTSTEDSRRALPDVVEHSDAAETAGAAMLLGAAIAAGDAELLRYGFRDRLHEHHRAAGAPLLDLARAATHGAAIGVTLSGSGPSVIVWAAPAESGVVTAKLRGALGDRADVLPLAVAREGATATGSP